MTDRTEALDIEAIERRAEQATPGEWWVSKAPNGAHVYVTRHRHPALNHDTGDDLDIREVENAEFIAHARSDIPALIQALKASNEENICDACGGTGVPTSGPPCMCNGSGKMSDAARYLREELVASNEAVERVRALVKDHRSRVASPYIHVARLEAALSHPISPERSDEGEDK